MGFVVFPRHRIYSNQTTKTLFIAEENGGNMVTRVQDCFPLVYDETDEVEQCFHFPFLEVSFISQKAP